MSRPASTTRAPSGTGVATSFRSAAPAAERPPSSGPPGAPPAAPGTASRSSAAAGNSPWRHPCAELRGLLSDCIAEAASLRLLLPPPPVPLADPLRGWPPWPADADGGSPGAPFPFAGLYSLFLYEGPAREGIRLAKYGGMSRLAAPLAAGIFRAIRGPWADRFPAGLRPAVVPVPIGPWKYFRRGYNFPALIGEPLSRLAGWPFAPWLLRRTGGSRPQAGLPLSERVRNVRGAFEAGAASAGAVLLVDDVYTSGATAAACARALRSAGVETVLVVTAARALP